MDKSAQQGYSQTMTDSLHQLFVDAFGAGRVGRTAGHYLSDWRGRWQGAETVLLRPDSTAQVAEYVRFCGEHRVGIIPFGGGTGLVGGHINIDLDNASQNSPQNPSQQTNQKITQQTNQKPPKKPTIVISLEKLNKIREINPESNIAVVEAGVTLGEVIAQTEQQNRLFPLNIGSAGTCRIGGNLATNAGGMQVLRYGMMADLCLGVEAVMPNGQIMNGLAGLRKDNAGYDLTRLLVGSEGTLGIITAAVLRLFPLPKQHLTAFIAVANPTAALTLLNRLQDASGGRVSVCELIDRVAFDFLAETFPDVRVPFADPPQWSVLLELGLDDTDFTGAFESCLAGAMRDGLISDARLASSAAQRRDFWHVREMIPEANRKVCPISSHDISLPLTAIAEFIGTMARAIAALGALRINCFGHLGDGNLHYDVFAPKGESGADYADLRENIQRLVHDGVAALGGSISAEHGIGRMKRDDLVRYGDAGKLAAMRAIKAALDPEGIMNPGAVVSC